MIIFPQQHLWSCTEHDGTSAGVEWVAKRWHSATDLIIRGDSDLLQSFARQLHRGCADLASVESMLLDTYYGHQDYEACPKYMASLFYLLAHLSGLRTLKMHIYSMQLLPPLSGLKELFIIFSTPAGTEGVVIEPDSLRSLLECLHEFSSLERLSLDASPWESQCVWVDHWAPPLLLGMLPNLTSMSLNCFAPECIYLPLACRLGLRLCQEGNGMDVGKWRCVQRNLVLFSLQDREMDMAMTPALLCQELPSLESVTLSVASIGGSARFFPRYTLMHVKALQLVARKIWMHIPADVTWEEVRVEAFDVLSFTFEDVAAFVRAICRFQISYNLASGAFLADLFCELGRQGLHWKATQSGSWTTLYLNIAEGETFDSMNPIEVYCK